MSRKKQKATTINILLDEDIMPRHRLPRLNRRELFCVRHIEHDLGRGGIKDTEVLSIAIKNSQILFTFDKGFKKRHPQKNSAIVVIANGEAMSSKDLQDTIIDFFERHTYPDQIIGGVFSITQKNFYRVN